MMYSCHYYCFIFRKTSASFDVSIPMLSMFVKSLAVLDCRWVKGTSPWAVSLTVDFGSPSWRAPEPQWRLILHLRPLTFPPMPGPYGSIWSILWLKYLKIVPKWSKKWTNSPRHSFGSFACEVCLSIFNGDGLKPPEKGPSYSVWWRWKKRCGWGAKYGCTRRMSNTKRICLIPVSWRVARSEHLLPWKNISLLTADTHISYTSTIHGLDLHTLQKQSWHIRRWWFIGLIRSPFTFLTSSCKRVLLFSNAKGVLGKQIDEISRWQPCRFVQKFGAPDTFALLRKTGIGKCPIFGILDTTL